MDYETRNLLHNICWFARGVAGVSIPGGVRFGKGTGLSESRAVAILRELEVDGYIDFHADPRVTLTAQGVRWYEHNRRRSPRIPVPVRIRIAPERRVRTKTQYRRLGVSHARIRRYYRRAIRLQLRLPHCPSAWYQWGRWACDVPALADWLNFVTRFWLRRHEYDPRHVWPLISYIVDEYHEYLASAANPEETAEGSS